MRYLAPGAAPADALTWDVDDPPVLGPGPLPLPALQVDAPGSARSGSVDAPASGEPLAWKLEPGIDEPVTIAGRRRSARRHDLTVRGVTLTAWIDDSGLPLRVQLPGGIIAELAEDSR